MANVLPTWIADSFEAFVRGQSFKVTGVTSLPEASLQKVWEYGLQRILNDSAASCEGDNEKAIELAQKRWDNLIDGTLRASGGKSGNPITKRAGELAESAIKANAAFKAWAAKVEGDKEAVAKAVRAKLAELVKAEIAKGDESAFVKQAKIDVEAAKGLGAIEIDI